MSEFLNIYECNVEELDRRLFVSENFDIIKKKLCVGRDELTFYYIDGFVKDGILSKIMIYLLSLNSIVDKNKVKEGESNANAFVRSHLPYVETHVTSNIDDIGGVHGGRAGVNGVKVNVHIEEHVFHGQGVTVGELDAVLDNEGINGGIVLFVSYAGIILYNNSLAVAVCNGYLTVLIAGGKHSELSHSNDSAIIAAGCKEGIEQAVKIFGHNDESVGLFGLLSVATDEHHSAQKHYDGKDAAQNSFFHNFLQ